MKVIQLLTVFFVSWYLVDNHWTPNPYVVAVIAIGSAYLLTLALVWWRERSWFRPFQ